MKTTYPICIDERMTEKDTAVTVSFMESINSCHKMVNVTFTHLCTLILKIPERKSNPSTFHLSVKGTAGVNHLYFHKRTAANTVVAHKLYKVK